MFIHYTRPALLMLSLMLSSLAHTEQTNYPSESCAYSLPNHALNLPEVVNLALCNNPQTHEMWANLQAQTAQLGVSKASEFPSVALSVGGNRNWPTNASPLNQQNIGISASYLLYDFGARSANLASANLLLIAARASQESTVQNVFLSAIQAFYQTQAAHAALDAARVTEQSAQVSFAAAQARYSAGSATPADKLAAQTASSQAILNRITAEGDLKNSQGLLANIVGLDANKYIALVSTDPIALPTNFSSNVDTLIEQARQHRPDLQAIVAQTKAAQANTDAVRAAGQPTISLAAANNQNRIGSNNSNNSSIGINLSAPIFSGYAPTYRVRSAEALAEAKNAQLERLRLQVSLDVWTAYQNLNTLTQTLQTTADLLESATQSEHTALGRYKAGLGTMLDVLSAQSALANARQQRVLATFNWNISRATLAHAIGNLDADLLNAVSASDPRPIRKS